MNMHIFMNIFGNRSNVQNRSLWLGGAVATGMFSERNDVMLDAPSRSLHSTEKNISAALRAQPFYAE